MSLLRILRAVVFLGTLLGTIPALAQWTPVYTFGFSISSVRFLGDVGLPQVGFVAAGSFIYRTDDAGATWTPVLRPSGASASAFCFKDGQTGWCSAYGLLNGPACYRTSDGGKTWETLAPIGEGCDVYYNSTNRLLMLSIRTGQVLTSSDDGSSWTSFSAGMNGFAFSGTTGICSTITSALGGTTDGGQTWTNSIRGLHTWAPCVVPGSKRFIAPADLTTNVFRSEDLGRTWVASGSVGGKLTGCAQATECATFVQTSLGMFVSTNSASWSYLGGPGNFYDTRFCISDGQVWAGDIDGHLMRTSASTPTWPTLHFDRVPQAVVVPAGCEVDTLSALVRNLTCTGVSIVSASLSDSSVWRLRRKSYPIFVGATDSVEFSLTADPPAGGVYTSSLTLRLQNVDGITDTSITLRVDASRFRKPIIDSMRITAVQCIPTDTVIRIHNRHCDTIILADLKLLDSSILSISGLTTPVGIPPDSDLVVPIRFQAHGTGNYVAKIRAELTYGAIILDTTFQVRANVLYAQPTALLSTSVLRFDTVTTCQEIERSVRITNTTCDLVTLSEINLYGDPELTIVSPHVPVPIGSGKSVDVLIHLKPRRVSTPSAHLAMMLVNGSVEKLYEADLRATVVEATHGYAVTPNSISADSLAACFAFDTTIVLSIIGECDSMRIESITADSTVSLTVNRALPAWIRGTDRVVVTVHLDPSRPAGDAVLRFHGPQFDSSVPIHFSFRADAPNHLTASASSTNFIIHRCDRDSATIDLAAFGCSTVAIDSITLEGAPEFQLGPGAPTVVETGGGATFKVYIDGTVPGSYQTNVAVYDALGEKRTVSLSAIVLPQDTTALAIRIDPAPSGATAGSTIASEIYFTRGAIAAAGLNEIDCQVAFDRDVLGETTISGEKGWNVAVVNSTPASIDLHCTRQYSTDIASGDKLLTIRHRATVSRALATPVQLTYARLMPSVPGYTDCILTAAVDTATITVPLQYDCGDSLFSRYLSGELLVSNIRVSPSPTAGNATLTFAASRALPAILRIAEITGREVFTAPVSTLQGLNVVPLDLQRLPSGTYSITLESGRTVATAPLVVQK